VNTGPADSGNVLAALRALAGRLAGRFPDLPIHSVAAAVSDAWQAAQLIGVDTVETVEHLAREQLSVLRRRQQLLRELGRHQTRAGAANHTDDETGEPQRD
jgi:hypothetical protein